MKSFTQQDARKRNSNSRFPTPMFTPLSQSSKRTANDETTNITPESSFNRDFSQIPLHNSAVQNESNSTDAVKSCSLSLDPPRTCPFGGACHSCPTMVQTKLTINKPGDIYEQEADRVAEQVMRMNVTNAHHENSSASAKPLMSIQRKCSNCKGYENEDFLQMKSVDSVNCTDSNNSERIPQIVNDVIHSPGEPLNRETRAFFEPRFHHDFSQVRVHTDAKAADSARMVKALGYTVGNDIVLSKPIDRTSTDQKLLMAHELTHTIQQSKKGFEPTLSTIDSSLERSADRTANEVVFGTTPVAVYGTSQIGLARQPISLSQTMDPKSLSDLELQKEVNEIRQWLSTMGNVSNPDIENMQHSLQIFENEAHRRYSKPAEKVKNPPIPKVTGNDKEDLKNVMSIVESIKASELSSGMYSVVIQGQGYDIDAQQVEELRKKAKSAIGDNIRQVISRAEYAHNRYISQSEIDKEHWIVAPIVKAIGRVKDPGPLLIMFATQAKGLSAAAGNALASNQLVVAASLLADAEIAATKASKMWQAYFDQIIGSSEMTVTTLEYTRNASFITLGVLAIIATGGAAAGAAGVTTTVAGIEVGTATAANVIATGAPIVATLGSAGVQAALGDKVDWGKVAIDVAVSLVLAKFGGKISDGIFKVIANNPGVQNIGRIAAGRIISSILTGAASRTFTTSVETIYKLHKGQDITWNQYTDELLQQITDPKAGVIDIIMGAITVGAQVKYGGTPSSPGKAESHPGFKQSTPAAEQPPAPNPVPAPSQPKTNVISIAQASKRSGPVKGLKPGIREVTSLESRRQQASQTSGNLSEVKSTVPPEPVAAKVIPLPSAKRAHEPVTPIADVNPKDIGENVRVLRPQKGSPEPTSTTSAAESAKGQATAQLEERVVVGNTVQVIKGPNNDTLPSQMVKGPVGMVMSSPQGITTNATTVASAGKGTSGTNPTKAGQISTSDPSLKSTKTAMGKPVTDQSSRPKRTLASIKDSKPPRKLTRKELEVLAKQDEYTDADINSLANHLGITPEEVKQRFIRASQDSAPQPSQEEIAQEIGMNERKTIGGKPINPKTETGLFSHKYAEQINDFMKQNQTAEKFMDNIPKGKIEAEFQIEHPDFPPGKKPRIDRLDWDTAKIYEIKPRSPYWIRKGTLQGKQYVEWMNRFHKIPDGKEWTFGGVITYDQDAVFVYLKEIGVLPKNE